MKIAFYLLTALIFSCKNSNTKNKLESKLEKISSIGKTEQFENKENQTTWKGTLNSKINILLNYQIQDNLIIGEITYLDTKEKKAIRIIGTIEEDKNFRLLEFDKKGNITGVLIGLPKQERFIGNWYSTKNDKEFPFELKKIDTILKVEITETNINNTTGEYHYQYGEKGYQGDMTIKKIDNDKISLNIFSVTRDPLRNIAEIPTDTIKAATEFIYKLPESDSCEFKVKFYKDFAFIKYTKGYCTGQFGHNATIDGIFLKQK